MEIPLVIHTRGVMNIKFIVNFMKDIRTDLNPVVDLTSYQTYPSRCEFVGSTSELIFVYENTE